MPFQTTATAPCASSKVTIVFSGLVVFRPGADNTCEVGIHRFNNSHVTQILLMVNKPRRPPMLIPLLKGPLTSDFSISLQDGDDPVPGDFKVFAPSPEPFDRFNQGNDEHDYRWAVNFKELDSHANVNINAGAEPLVKLTSGVLFTSHLSLKGLGPRFIREGDEEPIELNRIAASMAVAINPVGDAKVQLNWSIFGDPLNRSLPRVADELEPATTYTLFVINDPPDLTDELNHEEMHLYYKVLEDQVASSVVKTDERFVFEFEHLASHKTDEVPCLIGRLEP